MNIQRILSGYESGALAPRRNEPQSSGEPSHDATAPSTQVSSKFREILARYDMRNISPRDFSELVQKLFDSGEIGQAEVQELSLLRLELDKSHADADQPLDLVKLVQDKLRQQEDEINRLNRRRPEQPIDRDAALRLTRRQLEWVEKFASVQAGRFHDALDQTV
jgi:hypothetical protein